MFVLPATTNVSMKKIFHLFAVMLCPALLFAQSKKDEAHDLALQGIHLVDQGATNEGLKLLEKAHKLDPGNYNYVYEIGYAYYDRGDYKKALKQFKATVKFDSCSAQCYQMLGNTYDMLGDSAGAFRSYNEGLQRFPGSGRLYLEKGNVFLARNQSRNAEPYYEKGIELDPNFPSNYYHAAKYYLSSQDLVWGLIYGEIFMNLETNTKRTSEISKLLYSAYHDHITFKSDTSYSVDLTSNVIDISMLTNGKMTLPWPLIVYSPVFTMALIGEHSINLASLHRIRKNFVSLYYQNENGKKYPNVLFEFQQKIIDAGHFEAYNYWLLQRGDPEAYEDWKKRHEDEWEKFKDWFNNADMGLSNDHKFYKAQY